MKRCHAVFISLALSALGLNVSAQDPSSKSAQPAHQHIQPYTHQHSPHSAHLSTHHPSQQGHSAAPKNSATKRVSAQLQVQASTQVNQDELRLVFAHEAQGKTAAEVNRALAQVLEQARAAVVVPPAVSLASGSFRTSPSYNKDGQPAGWRGRAELILQSTDLAATHQVAGLLGAHLALVSVHFSLSPDKRKLTEQGLLKEVAQTFRDKAKAAANAFGFEHYMIVSLDFGGRDVSGNTPMLMRSAPAPASQSADPVQFSFEPATVQVSISVFGKVQFD